MSTKIANFALKRIW